MQENKQHKIRGRKPREDPKIIKSIILENKEKIICEGRLRPPSDRIWQEIKRKYKVIMTKKALYTFVSCNRWNIKCELGLLQLNINKENEEEEEADEVEEELDKNELMQKEQPSTSYQMHIPIMENWDAFGWNASFVVSGLYLYRVIF